MSDMPTDDQFREDDDNARGDLILTSPHGTARQRADAYIDKATEGYVLVALPKAALRRLATAWETYSDEAFRDRSTELIRDVFEGQDGYLGALLTTDLDEDPQGGPFRFCCHCGSAKEPNLNYVDDCGAVSGTFAFCGKCGEPKDVDINRVHVECLAPGSSPWRAR